MVDLLTPAEACSELELRAAARASMLEYVRYMDFGYAPAAHHRLMIEKLEAVERGDIRRLALFLPPGSAKPLSEESLVLCKSGLRKRLADIVVGDEVITKEGRPRRVLETHDQGLLPCLKIKTHGGREIISAFDHPFLTPKGWMEAGSLSIGDHLGCSSKPRVEWTEIDDDACRLAGYLAGDGCVTEGENQWGSRSFNCSITNAEPAIIDDVIRTASRLGFGATQRKYDENSKAYVIRLSGGVREWIRDIGIAGLNSHSKRIPSFVFEAGWSGVANFVAAYFLCDGSIYLKDEGGFREHVGAEITSVSKDLLKDTQHLLTRLGISSIFRERKGIYKYVAKGGRAVPIGTQRNEEFTYYRLTLASLDDIYRFNEAIPLVGLKDKKFKKYSTSPRQFEQQIISDKIVSVESCGEFKCRCLSIEEDKSFTANDFIVHNSTYASTLFPAWFLGRNPRKSILACSHTQDLADRFGRRVRNIFSSPEHTALFGVGIARDSAAASHWSTELDGEYFAAGVGVAISGRRADIGLIDDPVKNREEADSLRAQERAFDWYTSDFLPRLKPNASQILIQTRWSERDLAGRILEREASLWDVVEIPMEAGPNDPLGRSVGERLWADWFTSEMVEDAKKDARGWQALYQQHPVSDEGDYFRANWFSDYDPAELSDNVFFYGASDYAVTEGHGDFTEHGIFALDALGNIYVVAWWRGQTSPDVWIERQCDLIQEHDPLTWFGESGPIRRSIEPYLIARMSERGAECQLEWLPSIHEKTARAQAFRSKASMGKVFLPKFAPWKAELLAQLTHFPGGRYDDGVDVCSLIGRGLQVVRTPRLRRFTRAESVPLSSDGLSWMVH